MNELTMDVGAETASRNAATVSSLLNEYTWKLFDLVESQFPSASSHRERGRANLSEYPFLLRHRPNLDEKGARPEIMMWRRQREALHHLASLASSLIEHGRIDEAMKIELTLRLAEYERALELAEKMVNSR